MPLLVDTGFLYALADTDDDWHERAVAYLEASRELLVAPVTILPEVAYLLHERLGPATEQSFVAALVAGEITVEPLRDADLPRAQAILERHPEIGFVDATVVAVAERLQLTILATTDRRHFAPIRPRHTHAFELVP